MPTTPMGKPRNSEIAPRSLDGLDDVLGGESSHRERQLAVGGGLDGGAIDALDVLRATTADAIQFHDKLCIVHGFSISIVRSYSDLLLN